MRYLMTTKASDYAPDDNLYVEMGKFIAEMTEKGILLATGGLEPAGVVIRSEGDEITANIPLWGDAAGNSAFSLVDKASTVLYKDGVKVGESTTDGSGRFTVPPEGGNYVLSNVVQENTGMALFPTEADWRAAREVAGIETSMDDDMHAGEFETSILLHAHPELVREDYAQHDELTGPRPHMLTLGLGAYTGSGVIGRPSLASADKGRRAVEHLVAGFGQVLDVLTPSS
ncbi:creatininase family protein [Kibdelosporangium lantanae]|uniref:Creatininase family protein n=1 Tax=Kibdelosporangium lantanae TaxID=1497396 RepID=A0ABW3MC63_9PSEU